jgi:hypothetical protein
MTLLQTVFASPSVLRAAHAAGLPLEDSSASVQRAAGFFAKQNSLLVAYELGLQCTGLMMHASCFRELTQIDISVHLVSQAEAA